MRPPLDAFMDYLATIDGARPALFVMLLWVSLCPRLSAATMAGMVAIHMFWMNP